MAAGSTYTPIATTTLASSTASYTFSSIPSTYTDLVVVVNATTAAGSDLTYRVNGDTGTNYSSVYLYGTGSTPGSARSLNASIGYTDYYGTPGTTPSVQIINFMSYASTSVYKPVLSRANRPSSGVDLTISLWRSTAAINSITLTGQTSNLLTGSTLTLYGIAAA